MRWWEPPPSLRAPPGLQGFPFGCATPILNLRLFEFIFLCRIIFLLNPYAALLQPSPPTAPLRLSRFQLPGVGVRTPTWWWRVPEVPRPTFSAPR